MELVFQEQQIEFSEIPSSDEVFTKINDLLDRNYYFSHFIADGTEIYEDHEAYLNVNLDRIEKIEIIAKTEKEFMNDIFLSAEDYLKRAKPELAALTDGFYSNPTAETHTSFSQLMDGLQWLDEMLTLIAVSSERPPNGEVYEELMQTLQTQIAQLGVAVENSDNILIADIIQYELIPIFKKLETIIGESIDMVGTRHDLS
ncbi:hypothetical protein H7992_18890 [Sporosarcina sp. resist]|uniref:hypothetical protein n=1 Tax=Sporosarcina sp. resist TaxID=2762563 RepID=UPI00164DD828|nr:hypothetical protein [Sporosarcina sp. resist]QNK87247.1 hypothetical protein H7992_18890 [Sporosarcina sp. resist]